MENLESTHLDPNEVTAACERVCAPLEALIPFDRIGVGLLEDGGSVLRLHWAKSKNPSEAIPVGYAASVTRGSLAKLLATGQTRVLNDLEAYLVKHPESDSTRRLVRDGYRSSLSCVLRVGEKNIGVIFFSSRRPGTYQYEHEQVYTLVASALSASFERLWTGARLGSYEAREGFVDMILHDLRGPLNIIRGRAEMLLASDATGDSRHSCESILEQVDVLCRLLRDIERRRDLETPQYTIERRKFALRPFLKTLEEAAQILARSKNIQFSLEAPVPTEEWIEGDPQRLMQVFGNLIANALKYSAPRTSVIFSVDLNAREIVFSVQDHGSGIPRAQLTHLFGPSGSVPRGVPTLFEPSRGLGLAVCRKIVEAHEGRIWAESEYGRGSVFHVALPRDPSR